MRDRTGENPYRRAVFYGIPTMLPSATHRHGVFMARDTGDRHDKSR
jgi:hypothetical protein